MGVNVFGFAITVWKCSDLRTESDIFSDPKTMMLIGIRLATGQVWQETTSARTGDDAKQEE